MRTESGTRSARRLSYIGYVVAALVIGVTGFGTTTYAQSARIVRVNIDFAFVAAKQEMPAGAYEFEVTPGQIILRPGNVKASPVIMPVLTRLGRHDNDPDPELVFDKVDGKFLLSEVWLFNADGFLLLNTPADHEHRVIGGSKPHK